MRSLLTKSKIVQQILVEKNGDRAQDYPTAVFVVS